MAACAAGEESSELSKRDAVENLVWQAVAKHGGWCIVQEQQLDGAGAVVLMNAMHSYHNLRVLNLTGNSIGAKGWSAVATHVANPQACALVSLCLRDTTGTTQGAMDIGKAMETNKTLIRLNLSDNGLCEAGVMGIVSGLFENGTLKCLHLNRVNGNDQAAAWLGMLLLRNNSITTLEYDNNDCDQCGSARLADALYRNTTLTKLHLERSLTLRAHTTLRLAMMRNTVLLDVRTRSVPSVADESRVRELWTLTPEEITNENRAALNEAKSRAACTVWCWELLPLSLGLGGVPQDVLRCVVKDVRGDIRVKRLEIAKRTLETDANPAPSKRSRTEGDSA